MTNKHLPKKISALAIYLLYLNFFKHFTKKFILLFEVKSPTAEKHLSLTDGGFLFKYLSKFLQPQQHGLNTLVCAAPCEVAPTAVECPAYIKCLSAAQTCQSCTSTSQKSRAIILLAAEQTIFMPPLTHTSSLGCGSR